MTGPVWRASQPRDLAITPDPPATHRRLSPRLLALALALPVLVVGAAVLRRFDGLYGQDPFAYYDYAVGPLRAAILSRCNCRPISPGRPAIPCWSR
ncbi:MAG: hypothetical protein R2844_08225 [Caldilineales bacterium]